MKLFFRSAPGTGEVYDISQDLYGLSNVLNVQPGLKEHGEMVLEGQASAHDAPSSISKKEVSSIFFQAFCIITDCRCTKDP